MGPIWKHFRFLMSRLETSVDARHGGRILLRARFSGGLELAICDLPLIFNSWKNRRGKGVRCAMTEQTNFVGYILRYNEDHTIRLI